MVTRRSATLLLIGTLCFQRAITQDCKTSGDLDAVPGKFLTAAQYPWPAVRAEYFNKMTTAADKVMARKILGEIEKAEEKTHTGFNLTGGNWENYYSTEGYGYMGATRLGRYTFQSALHEFFCFQGKLKRNSEYGTVLRIYVNSIPLNTLDKFLRNPFGSSIGDYDFGFQFQDWKNHKPVNVQDPLISLFNYFSCNTPALIDAINSGERSFQDTEEKYIKPNTRNEIYRYWFVKKNAQPVLVPVSRKEYLQSLLEYYEREKLYFPKLIAKLTADRDNGVKQYSNWEKDVNDKITIAKRTLGENNEEWLSAQAVINRIEDNSLNSKAGLKERLNYNRFWKFYDGEKKSDPLYKYNIEYFKTTAQGTAKPQLISFSFRYVHIPVSLRVLNNFVSNFDFNAIRKLLE